MANICENELRVFSEDCENITAITAFFNDKFPHCSIDDVGDNSLVIYFDSKWDFPRLALEDLIEKLHNKNEISMQCLSVEWGNEYCEFHNYRDGEWV